MTSGSPSNRKLERTEYRSLGLNYLLSVLPPDQEISILDLGPALGQNVGFWAEFRCRLAIVDFYHDYREAVAANPEISRSDLIAGILSFCSGQTFDLLLVWDLLNHLESEEVEVLLQVLKQRCRPGSFLFAMLSSQPSIPAHPMIFRILDRERMVHEAHGGEEHPCLRLQPRDLARMLPEFDISGSYLLRHGLQEFVLCRRSSGPPE